MPKAGTERIELTLSQLLPELGNDHFELTADNCPNGMGIILAN
jgi:hypothetical protein